MKFIENIIEFLIYWISKISFFVLFKIFYRLKVKGVENIPDKGGVIIASNHASFLDPPIIGVAAWKRKCIFMARHTLFRNKIAGFILKKWGSFPIKRGSIDRNAWFEFEKKVKEGYVVVFFPEGTRTEDGEIKQGKPGAGMLIYNSKVKVIPAYIHNTYKAFSKKMKLPRIFVPVTVIFGKPLDFSDFFTKEAKKENYEEITKILMNEIIKLKNEFLQGVKK